MQVTTAEMDRRSNWKYTSSRGACEAAPGGLLGAASNSSVGGLGRRLPGDLRTEVRGPLRARRAVAACIAGAEVHTAAVRGDCQQMQPRRF